MSCLCVRLGGGDIPELEAGEEAEGRECEGLHLSVWGVLVWWEEKGLSGTLTVYTFGDGVDNVY